MAIKRDHNAAASQLCGLVSHLGDYCLVAAMHTVVCANGDHRALTVGLRRIGFLNDEHEDLRYRFGQNDRWLSNITVCFVHRK